MMMCSKINNFKTIQEFILVSPAPVETAAKLSQNFIHLSEREKERAKDLLHVSKFCETMCTELVTIGNITENIPTFDNNMFLGCHSCG